MHKQSGRLVIRYTINSPHASVSHSAPPGGVLRRLQLGGEVGQGWMEDGRGSRKSWKKSKKIQKVKNFFKWFILSLGDSGHHILSFSDVFPSLFHARRRSVAPGKRWGGGETRRWRGEYPVRISGKLLKKTANGGKMHGNSEPTLWKDS